MRTGRGYMDVNRISGYLPGKMVFFLMQVRAAVGLLCWLDEWWRLGTLR